MKNLKTIEIGQYSYFPDCPLGRGATGKVYKGLRKRDSMPVAVKAIELKDIDSALKSHLLSCEVEALSKIKHNYVCENFAILKDNQFFFVVMEQCSKGTLKDYIKSKKSLNEKDALQMFQKVIEGYCGVRDHGYVHRDLKTQNILLRENMDPVLIDFGYCEKFQTQNRILPYNVGSPAYMSPESYNDNFYSEKSDIWSLGIVLHEMLTGTIPVIRESNADEYFSTLKTKQTAQIVPNCAHYITGTLIRSMLTVNHHKRATCEQIRSLLKDHPLLNRQRRNSSKETVRTAQSFTQPNFIKKRIEPLPQMCQNRLLADITIESNNSIPPQDLRLSSNQIRRPPFFSFRNSLNLNQTTQDISQKQSKNHVCFKGSVRIQRISCQLATTPTLKPIQLILSKNKSLSVLTIPARHL